MTDSAPSVAADGPAPGRPWLAPLGAAIGCVGAVCGIGGGLFATPLQHYGLGVPLKRAVATSLALVLATASAATGTEALRADGHLPWTMVLAILPTALIGAQVGFRINQRVSTRGLKGVFVVVLAVAAARLLWTADRAGLPPAEDLTLVHHALGAFLGLFVGVVVPLLGIGGGLVVVPGLLFLVPEVGFSGARAVSLACAVVTSSRSLLLFWGADLVDRANARWLALGAFLGAMAGVQLVHLEGASRVGQLGLAGVMLFAAWRFARDVFAPPARPQA